MTSVPEWRKPVIAQPMVDALETGRRECVKDNPVGGSPRISVGWSCEGRSPRLRHASYLPSSIEPHRPTRAGQPDLGVDPGETQL